MDQAAETLWAARPGGELCATLEVVASLRAKLDGLELAVAHELDTGPAGQQVLHPRRRPHPTTRHRRDLDRPGPARPALRLSRLPPPPVMCHAHHIVHWIDGGPTSLDNLVLLCGAHHRIIHGTPWQVRLGADRRPEFRPPGSDTWTRDRAPTNRPPRGREPPDG